LESFKLVKSLIDHDCQLADKDAVRAFFTKLTGLYKNLNYSEKGSSQYGDYRRQLAELVPASPGGATDDEPVVSDKGTAPPEDAPKQTKSPVEQIPQQKLAGASA
jgi:hypothetical protein